MTPPAEGLAARLVHGPVLRTQADRRLVTLVREGYETAFEEIVRRYGKPLTRYAAAIVGSRSEDVTQDAFSKALLALRRDSDEEIELRPWLFRIVRNTALNDLRDSPPAAELLAEAIAGGSNPAEEIERREELADLMHRLQSLPDRQRAAIVMRELEGLSHEEIAAALGLSGGAARQVIFRARQALRDGFGMLLPLPLVRLLIDHGGEMAVAGAGTGGAAAASGALGSAGAGVAMKAATATVLVAGAIGAGVAAQHDRHGDHARAASEPAAQSAAQTSSPGNGSTTAGTTAGSGSASGKGDDRGGSDRRGESEAGSDSGSRHDSAAGPGEDPGAGGPGGGDRHGGPSGGDDHSGGGPGPSGDDGGSHGGSPSSGHSGQGGGGGSDEGLPGAKPVEGGSSGPGSGDSLDSSSSGSGAGPEGDSSGSGSGGYVEGSDSRGDGSASGGSGGSFTDGE